MAPPGPAHRDLGLDLRRLARRVLSEETGAPARASIRQPRIQFDRDQRLVLLAPASVELSTLVRRDAAGIYLQRQRRAFHHPHEEATGRGNTAGELFRVRSSLPAREARSDPLAISTELRMEPGAVREIFRIASTPFARGCEPGE